jgi:hypothetical protein
VLDRGFLGRPLFVHGRWQYNGLTGSQVAPYMVHAFGKQTAGADSQGGWAGARVLAACFAELFPNVLWLSPSHHICVVPEPTFQTHIWDRWCKRVFQCGASGLLKTQKRQHTLFRKVSRRVLVGVLPGMLVGRHS